MASESILDSLDKLESKVKELERKVLGNEVHTVGTITVLESLTEAERSVKEAAENRKSIASLLARRQELQTYLDPSFETSDTVTLARAVLTSSDEIADTVDKLKEIQKLGSGELSTSSLDTTALAQLAGEALTLKEQTDAIKAGAQGLLDKYSEVIRNTNMVLHHLSSRIQHLETDVLNPTNSH